MSRSINPRKEMNDMNNLLRITDLIDHQTNGQRNIPVSKATLYRMINSGRFPAPTKLGRISVWQEAEILDWKRSLVTGLSRQGGKK
jgi:predicted DNA-binding transcriptional regulator AlpA